MGEPDLDTEALVEQPTSIVGGKLRGYQLKGLERRREKREEREMERRNWYWFRGTDLCYSLFSPNA
eukprot:385460-Amorphochlora_amoeboformis.AAC.2